MKKKISLICLYGIILFGVYGCGKTSDNNTKKQNDENNEKLVYVNSISGLENEDIILSSGQLIGNNSFVVTESNKGYFLNLTQKYSNDTNYKLIDRNNKISGFGRASDLLSNGCQYFSCNPESLYCSDTLYNYRVDDCYPDFKLRNNDLYVNQNNQVYYTNGERKDTGHLVDDTEISNNEKIGAIYRTNIKNATYILKTNNAFYLFIANNIITNNDECKKYADIKCKYEIETKIVKDNILSNEYENIKYITDNFIIFNNGNVYSYKN